MNIAANLVAKAREAGVLVATAESCTGGMVAAAITDLAGASHVFDRGFITYSNEAKTEMLGVRPATLDAHGAVSEAVAREMALGALARSNAGLAVAVTGIAGPGGGSEEKPVGTVHVALAGPGDGDLEHRKVRFPGGRGRVRRQTSQLALELLRRDLRAREGGSR